MVPSNTNHHAYLDEWIGTVLEGAGWTRLPLLPTQSASAVQIDKGFVVRPAAPEIQQPFLMRGNNLLLSAMFTVRLTQKTQRSTSGILGGYDEALAAIALFQNPATMPTGVYHGGAVGIESF